MRTAASLLDNGNILVPEPPHGQAPRASGGYEVGPDDPYYRKALLMLPAEHRRRAAHIAAARRVQRTE